MSTKLEMGRPRARLLFMDVALVVALVTLTLIASAQSGVIRVPRARADLPWSDPPNYRIVYLVADGTVPADGLLASSRLQGTLGAQVAHTWADFLALEASAGADALVLHETILPMVDDGWLARAYRRGVVVGAFNVYAPQLADLLQAPCIADDAFASEPYPGQFFVIVSHLVLGQPEDVALIEGDTASCGGHVVGVRSRASTLFQRSTDSLYNGDDFNIFARALVSHLEGIQQARADFERTPAP